jgi:hypothetical protein
MFLLTSINLSELDVVLYGCNPSYLEGKCRKIKSSKPAQAKVAATLLPLTK